MKAISPLISAVLLIAFTVTVGAIISGWLTSFTRESSETVGEHAEEQITCVYAGIDLRDITYNTSSNLITGIIKNTGNVDLYDVDVQTFYTNASSVDHQLNLNISAGDEVSFSISSGCSSVSEIKFIRVRSTTCPNIDDKAEPDEFTLTT